VLIGLVLAWTCGVFDHEISEFLVASGESLPQDGRPAFVVMQPAGWKFPPNATLKQRLLIAYFKVRARVVRNNLAAHSFGPSPVRQYTVPGLLNQCMQATGTRYLIAREAVSTTVYFGHSNTLNGVQWVAGLEQALRDQGLRLIRDRPRVVKVIPEGKLADYRRAGLVKAGE
jgi:hypothetical protein